MNLDAYDNEFKHEHLELLSSSNGSPKIYYKKCLECPRTMVEISIQIIAKYYAFIEFKCATPDPKVFVSL